jgi:hypothetical protein
MSQTFAAIFRFIRAVITLSALALLGVGGWLGYSVYHERERLQSELADRTAEVERLSKLNARLELALRLMKIDHRVAEIRVVDQHERENRAFTSFQFVELNKDGDAIGEKRTFSVEGDMIYVDAWVIKYADELVERGDPLRSTSVCLFRRIFGEHQQPSQGFALDAAGSRPAVYSQGDAVSPAEKDIWANFWDYANNPTKAKAAGVRAAHGEAPFIRLEKGKLYKVELRASGGLSIVAEDLPGGRAS